MTNESARETAVKLLGRIENGGAYSNILLDEYFKKSNMNLIDKRFCTALFYGTLELRYKLDKIISFYSLKPAEKLNSDVRNILRTALYQILFMNSVPESAAVNEAVKLVKSSAVKGYVNALLRNFLRSEKKLPSFENKLEQIAFDCSCPPCLVDKLCRECGEDDAMDLLEDSLEVPPVTVKANTFKTTVEDLKTLLESEGFAVKQNEFIENYLEISGGSPEASRAFKNGLFHVQDLASGLCCKALNPKAGMTVLDMCAAPGGKTFTIAEMMDNKGCVKAFDLHENRVRLITSGAKRIGLSSVTAAVNNAKVYNSEIGFADAVLCDVPCSGFGVIRHKPEIKYKSFDELDKLAEIQYKILDCSASYLKAGGTLIYSTCTLSKVENDRNAEKFLKEHTEFAPAALWNDFGYFDGETSLSVFPSYFGSDGFYISKFVRMR